jgi:hypothetical protein
VFHHRQIIVKHSDVNKRYVVTCCHGCTWTVHARKGKDDSWGIASDRKHVQLSSRFISQKLVNIIKNYSLMTVTLLIKVVMVACGYRIKYGRVSRTKQRAIKLIYDDWAEAYKRLLTMLHAMKAKNSGMNFKYVPKPDIVGSEGRQYFFHAF